MQKDEKIGRNELPDEPIPEHFKPKGLENGVHKNKRMNVRFPEKAMAEMDFLKQRLGAASYVETIRFALSTLTWLANEVDKGREIYSAGAEGNEKLFVPVLMESESSLR